MARVSAFAAVVALLLALLSFQFVSSSVAFAREREKALRESQGLAPIDNGSQGGSGFDVGYNKQCVYPKRNTLFAADATVYPEGYAPGYRYKQVTDNYADLMSYNKPVFPVPILNIVKTNASLNPSLYGSVDPQIGAQYTQLWLLFINCTDKTLYFEDGTRRSGPMRPGQVGSYIGKATHLQFSDSGDSSVSIEDDESSTIIDPYEVSVPNNDAIKYSCFPSDLDLPLTWKDASNPAHKFKTSLPVTDRRNDAAKFDFARFIEPTFYNDPQLKPLFDNLLLTLQSPGLWARISGYDPKLPLPISSPISEDSNWVKAISVKALDNYQDNDIGVGTEVGFGTAAKSRGFIDLSTTADHNDYTDALLPGKTERLRWVLLGNCTPSDIVVWGDGQVIPFPMGSHLLYIGLSRSLTYAPAIPFTYSARQATAPYYTVESIRHTSAGQEVIDTITAANLAPTAVRRHVLPRRFRNAGAQVAYSYTAATLAYAASTFSITTNASKNFRTTQCKVYRITGPTDYPCYNIAEGPYSPYPRWHVGVAGTPDTADPELEWIAFLNFTGSTLIYQATEKGGNEDGSDKKVDVEMNLSTPGLASLCLHPKNEVIKFSLSRTK